MQDAARLKPTKLIGAVELCKIVWCLQDKTANDLIRALKAVYVTTSNPQEDGTNIPTAFKWMTLAKVAGTFFKHAPGISCMLGPMDAAPKASNSLPRLKIIYSVPEHST